MKLQELVKALELGKDDLEQYRRRVCVRIEDVSVNFEETAHNVYEKVGDLLKVVFPEVLVSCINRAHRIGPEYI